MDMDLILDIYEDVFNHKAFTGRSGTFYGYEGLGLYIGTWFLNYYWPHLKLQKIV